MPLSNSERAGRCIARKRSADADIGVMPAPLHPSWREKARTDLVFFACVYCRSRTTTKFLKWRPDTAAVEYLRALEAAILGNGRIHVRFPRGAGKTSICKCALLWAILFGYRKYIFAGAANGDNAKSIINDLWDMLEFSPRLLEDFPEATIPIRKLAGRMQRCASQHQCGTPTRVDSTADGFTMPTVVMWDGQQAPSSGGVFVSRGYTAGVRGLVRGSLRPDFALIDDPQKQKGAASDTECDSIESWIQGDVSGLAGRDRAISMVMTTTPICDGDVSERFADRNLHPEWKTITVPLVSEWSENPDLWEQYLGIRAEDEFKDDKKTDRATAFYRKHQKKMDKGVVVIDRRAYDKSIQISAIQAVYDLKFTARDAFDSEYQLKPERNNTVYNLTPVNILSHVVKGVDPYAIPDGFKPVIVTVATDINRATAGLTSAMVAFDERMTAHVMWYGIFKTKITNDIPRVTRDKMTFEALTAHGRQITEALKRVNIESMWGIDASGEAYDVVNRLVSNALNLGICKPWAMTGQSGENFNPSRKVGVVGGMRNFTMELVDRDRHHRIGFLADYYRELAQTGWLGDLGSPGKCTLFDGGAIHADFAKQICAERLIAKDVKNGFPYWVWRASKNLPHDYGDAVYNCFALAGFRGINGTGERTPISSRKVAVCL